MADVTVAWTLSTRHSKVTGWKYLWLKTVQGFNPAVHCARCLVGKYDNRFGLPMAVNQSHEAPYAAGTILYFCGVSQPYRWANNFHWAGRVTPGAPPVSIPLWNGDTLSFAGLENLPFTADAARAAYPDRSASYLTCRNFQFGAHHYGNAA